MEDIVEKMTPGHASGNQSLVVRDLSLVLLPFAGITHASLVRHPKINPMISVSFISRFQNIFFTLIVSSFLKISI